MNNMNMKNKDSDKLTIEQETIRDCPLLYHMRFRPMNETTMCWGWEFQSGWDDIIQRTSLKLEALNNTFYPRYRIRIQADQIKEKFGTLCFYYSIVTDPHPFKMWLASKCDNLQTKLFHFDFKLKQVVDEEPHDYEETEEITREKYVEALRWKASNVSFNVTDDGKIIKTTKLSNYGKSHYEPTKHILRWKLAQLFKKWRNRLEYSGKELDSYGKCAKQYMEEMAETFIKQAEKECESTCELCGSQIGTDWSPSCSMTGWIRFVCENCAKKSGHDYMKGDSLYNSGELVKSKEQIIEEHKEIEKKYEGKQKQYEEEQAKFIEEKLKELDSKKAN